ncbi:MAG: amino acid adenylation domain-containing protein [Ruminococcus flavefaciens]|nr:amino acid adenylation domain-containing protein [Ruminococcus flavefaciens]
MISQTDELISKAIEKVFGETKNFDKNTSLIQLGVNSLQIMKIAGFFRKNGVKVSFADLMENQTLSAWAELIEKKGLNKNIKKSDIKEKSSTENINTPYNMTDVQYSYWVGRGSEQPMGNVDCHAYYEFAGHDVNVSRLEESWKKILSAHSMLHTKFTKDGKQVTMSEPYPDSFHIYDFSGMSEEEQEIRLSELRNKLSHRLFRLEDGETAGMQHCILSNGKSMTIIDFALIVCDVQSIKIVLRDIAQYYCYEKLPETDPKWSFADYIETARKERREEYEKSEKYWQERIETLSLRPDIPLAKSPEQITEMKVSHHIDTVSSAEWDKLKKRSADFGVTPAMVLLTAYSQTIHRWSRNDKFLINMPLFDRSEEFGNVQNAVADFTTLLLSEQDFTEKKTFGDNIKKVSSDFIRDMRYASYSGVQIQRVLQKKYSGQRDFAPVVFACNIGMDFINDDFAQNIGEINYMISQTPQVWIDCQVFERNGELSLVWDTADELFPNGMTDDMFKTFIKYLHRLADDSTDWNTVIYPEISDNYIRKTIEETFEEYPEHTGLLTDGLIRNSKEMPDKTALYICETGEKITYAELFEKSRDVAGRLQKAGLKKGQTTAIMLSRGAEQIIAIYGVILAGGCYVPVSYDQPEQRLNKIFVSLDIKFVVTDKEQIPEGVISVSPYKSTEDTIQYIAPRISADDSAYIIMTSGSTGEPKGVEISHQSAMNTINDINMRIVATENDSVLGVSATDFDLSVYDIFGMSSVGGTLYILSGQIVKDADKWTNIITDNNISIWNSVPILFDMLITSAEQRAVSLPLRTIMLSGDWIGIPLVERCRKIIPQCKIYAMGGATEASIWSNLLVVPDKVPAEWKSIPYGNALKAQIYRVVDSWGRDCPDWVAGELWIGGAGTAVGYFNSEELTAKKFVYENGMKWYRTGDSGRFWSDGMIEFLGRTDFQVKIKGHRIELGEIESETEQCRGILKTSAVVYEKNGSRSIALFYTADKETDISENEILSFLKERIPSYMLPKIIIRLESMPVTKNGKLDRKALKVPDNIETETESVEFVGKTEKILADIWKENLSVKTISRNSDYFELGGNSLKATSLIYAVNKKFNVELRIGMIFRYAVFEKMAEYIEKLKSESER